MPDRAEAIYNALLSGVDRGSGRPRWEQANPHLLRYLLDYALDAGRIDELVADPEFLVHAHPAGLAAKLDLVESPAARIHAAIWRASAVRHTSMAPRQRRQVLALDAARFDAPAVSRQLANPADLRQALSWAPTWSTGAQVTHALMATLSGHGAAVRALAAAQHADREVVASGDANGTLRIRDALTGQSLCPPIDAHVGSVRALALCTCGGRFLAVSGGDDGRVRWWDVMGGRELEDRQAKLGGLVTALAAGSWNGRCVVTSAAGDLLVRIWDGATGAVIRALKIDSPANDLALADAYVVMALADGTAACWRLDADEDRPAPLGSMPEGARTIEVATVADRPIIVAADGRGGLRAWDIQSRSVVTDTCTQSRYPVSWIRSNRAASDRLVAASGDDVGVYDALRGWQYLPGHEDEVVRVASVNGRDTAVSGGTGGTVRTWTLAPRSDLGEPRPGHRFSVGAVTSGNMAGHQVFVSCGGPSVWIHRCADGEVLAQWRLDFPATALDVGEVDGRVLVAVADTARTIRFWDPLIPAPAGDSLAGHTGWVTDLTFARLEGRTVLISAGHDGSVRFWDTATGATAAEPRTVDVGWTTTLATAQVDGHPYLLMGGTDRFIRRWDLWDRTAEVNVLAHGGAVAAIAMTGDGNIVASASADGTIRVFDLPDLREREVLVAQAAGFTSLASGVVDDEHIVVGGDVTGLVQAWLVSSGQEIMAFQFPRPINCLRLASGGQLAVGFGRDLAVLERVVGFR
ncbi:WD40 repeat domain-containing protein [Dactylosporangium sp. CS-033363]|uniref:WD40 repeat domain-containing protein n=1 Tax=Dactylosporangium sp. CS-033363 TaxID=3239935 RepID=UPI003D8B6ED8